MIKASASIRHFDYEARTGECRVHGSVSLRIRKRPGGTVYVACRPCERGEGRRSRSDRYARRGITKEQYDAMLETQLGRCAICSGEPSALVIDHDHDTGLVRGLLCHHCNVGIGFLGDDPSRMRLAAAYVEAAG